jgi:hypothetical protein|nr:MAG TPA: hypothetical protein [Caudoviricetes sp.]
MLKYENVTFLKEPAMRLTREEFINLHLHAFWQDRKVSTRRKMLGAVHDLITGAKTRK